MDEKRLSRLKLIIRWLIGNNYATTQKGIGILLGYTNESSISQIVRGSVDLPNGFIKKICSLDKRINEQWLLTGEGEMLNKGHEIKDNSAIVNGNGNSVVSGENNRLEVSKCQDDLETALREIKHLQERLKDKEEMIVIMKGLLKSNNEPSDAS